MSAKVRTQRLRRNSPCVCAFSLLHVLLPLLLAHSLELEVSLVRLWSIFATLKDDKRNGANHGYEVERQVHEVPYDCARRELGEGLAH